MYGCGGTIARYVAEGAKVYVLILTEGSTAQYASKNMVAQKKAEAKKVQYLLGIKRYLFADFPDMRLNEIEHIKVNVTIESALEEIKPQIVFTHFSGDLNRDHKQAHDSTLVAVRPFREYVKKIYSYEVPSSTELGTVPFFPNSYSDISNFLDKKIKAIQLYKSELRDYPHPRSPEAVRSLASYRGYGCNKKSAEAFQLIRETW